MGLTATCAPLGLIVLVVPSHPQLVRSGRIWARQANHQSLTASRAQLELLATRGASPYLLEFVQQATTVPMQAAPYPVQQATSARKAQASLRPVL